MIPKKIKYNLHYDDVWGDLHAEFQNDWYKTVSGVALTRHPV